MSTFIPKLEAAVIVTNFVKQWKVESVKLGNTGFGGCSATSAWRFVDKPPRLIHYSLPKVGTQI